MLCAISLLGIAQARIAQAGIAESIRGPLFASGLTEVGPASQEATVLDCTKYPPPAGNPDGCGCGHPYECASRKCIKNVCTGGGGPTSSSPPPSPPPPPPSPPHSPGGAPTAKGALYIFPEKFGFNTLDFHGFPDAATLAYKFHTVALLANVAQKDWINGQVNDTGLKAFTAAGMARETWAVLDPESSSDSLCHCAKSCDSKTIIHDPSQCTPKIEQAVGDVVKQLGKAGHTGKNNGLAGIFVDIESVGGDATSISKAFEAVKKALGLKLGWSSSLGSAKHSSPKGQGTAGAWDICLGEAYTDTGTALFYKPQGCAPTAKFWDQIQSSYDKNVRASYAVPTLCGGGNCQQKPTTEGQENIPCIDERLTKDQLTTLLLSRPADYKYPNVAIWYGTPPEIDFKIGLYKSFCEGNTRTGDYTEFCCTADPNDKTCDAGTQCCSGWTIQDTSAIKPPPINPAQNCLHNAPCTKQACICNTTETGSPPITVQGNKQCNGVQACYDKGNQKKPDGTPGDGTWCVIDKNGGHCAGAT